MSAVVDSLRGHRAVPHTADVILEAWGPDLVSCLEEAVAALVGVFVDVRAADVVERRNVHLRPEAPESLLLEVLEEVIFALDTAEAVPVRVEVHTARDGGLDLELLLADPQTVTPTGAVPKAVSRSELEVRSRDGVVRCRFLVDV
jgi:SHS2 domain-containing protein